MQKIELANINLGKVNIIPENSILKNPKGTFVAVVENGIATMRPVELGMLIQEGIVIKSGLKNGDQVIVSNIAKVRPDAKVMVVPNEKTQPKEVK